MLLDALAAEISRAYWYIRLIFYDMKFLDFFLSLIMFVIGVLV